MIFKIEKRRRRKAGKVVEDRIYSLRYRLGDMPGDKWVSLKTSDKVVAHSKAEAFRKQKERELAGMELPPLQISARKAPIGELIADYVGELTLQRRDGRYVKGTKAKLERLAGEARWRTLADVTSDSFLAWRRDQSNLTAKTLNEYRGAALAFLKWLVAQDRLEANPLARIGKIDGRNDPKRERKAYGEEELHRLVAVSGQRAIIYKTAFYTGLRRNELQELQWSDIRQGTNGAFLQLRTSATKNGRADQLPLKANLAAELLSLRPKDSEGTDKVFAALPRMPRFYKDLELAGIPKVDAHGQVADFHSLRKTFSTSLALSGSLPRVTQGLMRHSDPKLTAGAYTDQHLRPFLEAVEKLPWLGELSHEYAQIGAQISDVEGRSVSQTDAKPGAGKGAKPVANKRVSRTLSQPVKRGQMVRAAGFEPATPSV